MMTRRGRWAWVVVVAAIGLAVSARWSLWAQDRAARPQARLKDAAPAPRASGVSVQDALLRPIDLPFGEETSLEAVRQYLAKALGAPVVLDRAALDRSRLTPEDTVQLDLKGVRLKVGLRLLLDQVGLSFKVEPEDNLLILTDSESSDDPSRRIAADLKSLHRDIHDLQDAVDDLRDLVEEELGVEPEVVKEHSTIVRLEKPRVRGRLTPRARCSIPTSSGTRGG